MGGLLERTALLTSAKWSYLITAQTKLEKKSHFLSNQSSLICLKIH